MHEVDPTLSERRQAIATYVETMSAVIPREASLTPVIESAIAHNILDPNAEIEQELIMHWYEAIFQTSAGSGVSPKK